MLIILVSFILDFQSVKDSYGIRFRNGSMYLTGGLKGGYAIYQIPVKKGTFNVKMKIKMRNLSGSTIGIYIKNYGDLKSSLLPPLIYNLDSSFYLWEGTDKNDWSSSRPEFLNLYQGKGLRFIKDGKIEILLYAGGGFFKRGRFLIEKIEIIEKGLTEDMLRIIEENGLRLEDNLLTLEIYFPYQESKNEAQKRALAVRGARLKGEKKIQDVLSMIGIDQPLHFEIISTEYLNEGVNVKIGLILNF